MILSWKKDKENIERVKFLIFKHFYIATVTTTLLSAREMHKLVLRKDKLDEMILNKRLKKSSANYFEINESVNPQSVCNSEENLKKVSNNNSILSKNSVWLNSNSISPTLINVYSSDKNSFITNFVKILLYNKTGKRI